MPCRAFEVQTFRIRWFGVLAQYLSFLYIHYSLQQYQNEKKSLSHGRRIMDITGIQFIQKSVLKLFFIRCFFCWSEICVWLCTLEASFSLFLHTFFFVAPQFPTVDTTEISLAVNTITYNVDYNNNDFLCSV